jgi:ubiquinone/menaquinone biosynthesis C-methylase UbiE
MNNRRNRFVYRLWAPVYDAVLERLFREGRSRSMERLALKAGERVCLVGVGTGADLLHLPKGVNGIGVDLSEAMLARRKEAPDRGLRHRAPDWRCASAPTR